MASAILLLTSSTPCTAVETFPYIADKPRLPFFLGRNPCECESCDSISWSVDTVSMNFRTQLDVMSWTPPCGPPVTMGLQFNSQDPGGGPNPFGDKWSFSNLSHVAVTNGVEALVHDGDGRIEKFTPPSGGYPKTYQSPPGDFRSLVETSSGTFTLTLPDGTAYHYGTPAAMQSPPPGPLLLDITDIHGNALSITHDSSGEIASIAHSMLTGQQSWSFTWEDVYLSGNETVRRITGITDPFQRAVSFTYNTSGNLETAIDMGGRQYGFGYVTKPVESVAVVSGTGSPTVSQELLISSITTPKGTTTVLTEPADGDENAFNTVWPATNAVMGRNYRVTLTDPEHNSEEYFYSACARQTWHRDATQLAAAVADSGDPKGWSGPFTAYSETLVGQRGQTTGSTLSSAAGPLPLFSATAHDAATGQATAVTDASNQTTWRIYYQAPHVAAGKLQCLRLPKSGNVADTDYEIRFEYTEDGKDILTVKRYLTYLDEQQQTVTDEITLAAYTYYTNRRPHTVTDANGRILTWTWYTNGLPDTVSDSVTEDTYTFAYDNNSYPSSVKINDVIVRNTAYDTKGRLLQIMDAAGLLTSSEYDDLNRVTREFKGNADGTEGSFVSRVWECCYVSETKSGKTTGGADKVLERTTFKHDHRGLVNSSTNTAGHVTGFGYDAAGRMTSLTDPNNNTTIWEYDDFGRFITKIYPDDTFESVTWNPANPTLPHHVTNRRGQSVWFSFDEHGLLTRTWGPIESSGGAQDFNITKTWDSWDRLDTIKDTVYSTAVHKYSYDLLGRVTKLDGPWDDDTITWDYDDANRTVTRTSPGTVTVETSTDEYGRLASLTDPLGSFTMGYEGISDILTTVTHSGGFNSEFEYFDADLGYALKKILSKKGSQEIARHDYTYDSLGRIGTWKRRAPLANPGTTHEYEWTMTHDFANQLTGVVERSLSGALLGGWTYGYEAAGNRYSSMHTGADGSTATATTTTHNNMNQITGIGGGGRTKVAGTLNEPGKISVGIAGQGTRPARMLADNRFEADLALPAGNSTLAVEAVDNSGNHSSYRYSVDVAAQTACAPTHDADGNMTSDGVKAYEWDSLNRLTKITWVEGVTTEFKYNALGQRAERIETDGSTVVHHCYLYDGIYLVERRTGTDPDEATADRRYFANGEQRWDGTAWQSYYYCRDHLGSVREVLTSEGTLVARYDYSPYGERITRYEASGFSACDLGFTGHITLPSPVVGQTELALAHYRVYNPVMARWLSQDPMGERNGINLYAYVQCNPLVATDPLGLQGIPTPVNAAIGYPSAAWGRGEYERHCAESSSEATTMEVMALAAAGTTVVATEVVSAVSSLPNASIAVGPGAFPASPIHVAWGTGGEWVHAFGNVGRQIVTRKFAQQFATQEAWFHISIKVLSTTRLMQEGNKAITCVTAAANAIARSWWPF